MKHVLLVYQEMIPSAVLCGHSQLQWLAEHGVIEYKHSSVLRIKAELVSWANVIVIIRGALEMDLLVAKAAKKAGKRIVYVLDDDLLNVPEHIVSAPFYNSKKTKKMIHEIMSSCDCFASPSLKLIEKYGKDFKGTALIEEPALNNIKHAENNSGKISICFVGSLDRTKDIETLISDVIRKLINEYGDRITVTFFGAKPAIVNECGLRYLDYVRGYSEYVTVMGEQNFDIGLAPMIQTDFSSCKHYNKYIEYASYGIVGVYSSVYPYTRAIRNKENGILCENDADSWYTAIATLIDEPELLKSMKDKCLEEVQTIYSLEAVANKYYENICICDAPATVGEVKNFGFRMLMYRFRHFLQRCWNFGVRVIKRIIGV